MRKINLFLVVTFILLISCKKDDNLSPNVPFIGNWAGKGISVIAQKHRLILNSITLLEPSIKIDNEQ